jgi:cell division protease FtsH
MDECEEAIERVIAGPERKSKLISDKEKDIVAYHEAGHALLGLLLENSDPVHKVTIIPRGRAGGYTLMLPNEDKNYHTRSELLDRVVGLLGGRAAEELALKEISTGAQNDLERATKTVRRMITEFGMSNELGHMTFGRGHEDQVFLGRDISRDRNYSEEVAAAIDREAKNIMDASYERATRLLTANRDKLEALTQALKDKETLEAEELKAIVGKVDNKNPEDNADAVSES